MSQAFEIRSTTILHKPELHIWERGGLYFFLDSEGPDWIATEERGARILNQVDGRKSFGELVHIYSNAYQLDTAKAWLHVHTCLRDAIRKGIIRMQPMQKRLYQGRDRYLKVDQLKEFWIHLTQACNLSCHHCLVSSSPHGEQGPDTLFYQRVIGETSDLGVERYFFTGGEPFMRKDIFELIRGITETRNKELIILTNAMLFNPERLERLKSLERQMLKFQVSLDGTTPETNDAIRGRGVFEKSSRGLKTLSELGFETSLTAVVTPGNLKELESLPVLAKKLGAKSVHLMWLHKRGRILESAAQRLSDAGSGIFPSNDELLCLARQVKRSAEACGVIFDNLESLKLRVNGRPHIKYDLGNLCWESLCLYIDGHLYPSPAMAGHLPLRLGQLNGSTVKALWLESELAQKIRAASVIHHECASKDPFRYLTGGGDIEHSYFFSSEGSFVAQDPYYNLQVELIKDVMEDLAATKRKSFNLKSGFDAPIVLHAMGEDAISCSEDAQMWLSSDGLPAVRLLHSNCVLSFDVEKPYRAIQTFYGKAAEKPQADLCCPVKYDDNDVHHIPKEVLDRFYGCGSPVSQAGVQEGETVLDLGCGAGIDCFIAAKKVGAAGRVIGVDMTPQMLEVARCSNISVAENLGHDVVEFRQGYLEEIPAQDRSVDLVISNCVINLSPDKRKVFAGIWRILKDNGRLVVADIVSDKPVPLSLQAHQELWGECISGSLSEAEFMSLLEKAGFYGISLMKKTFWKEVEGYKFYSITVRGYKYENKAGSRFIGQKAIYRGPFKTVMDEEGHLFPRGESVEVSTDTAEKLKKQPYSDQFVVLASDPQEPIQMAVVSSVQDCGPACCC